MKKLLIPIALFIFASSAQAYSTGDAECYKLEEDVMFTITEQEKTCYITDHLTVLIHNGKSNSSVLISDNVYEEDLSFGETTKFGHGFFITNYDDYHITISNKIVVLFGDEEMLEAEKVLAAEAEAEAEAAELADTEALSLSNQV